MKTVIRSAASRVNFVVGPMVMLIGVAAAATASVLVFALETPWFLMLLLPALMCIGAGAFILWMARRARLEIDDQGFRWCGFLGSERSLSWAQVHRILPPPPGSHARVAAIAQLRDGRQEEIVALWLSPTSPSAMLGGFDHAGALQALVNAHQQLLARSA